MNESNRFEEKRQEAGDSARQDAAAARLRRYKLMRAFPGALILVAAYLSAAVLTGLWHPLWIILLGVPLWYSALDAVKKGKPSEVSLPIFICILYLCLGFFRNAWHPGWLVFLAIPVYYGVLGFIRTLKN